MSDLVKDGGGRAPPSVRTPRDIMAERRAREARKQQEAERLNNESQRTADAERRSAAAIATERMGGNQRFDVPDPAQSAARIQEDLRASAPARQRPTSQHSQQPPKAHTLPGHRRSQSGQSGIRQSSAPTSYHTVQQPDPDPEEPRQRNSNVSSFPHAFDRWEQLSSHWEGLTSYWLRKIETNSDEIRHSVPSASALSRQIQDLSAAGANLFHAVVELQRLRASSERKFQRWFFETRAEQERSQEEKAELARLLQLERDAKEQAIASAGQGDVEKRTADRRVHEMQRELNISKAEARRAWEDLGRMEAEQRAWISNLRQGLPTVIGGVQVLPTQASTGGVSQTSERRPTSSEGPQRMHQSVAEQQQHEEPEPSPTNTDPFIEPNPSGQPLHHEPDVHSLAAGHYQPYPPGSTPVSTSTARTAISPQQQRRETASMSSPGFTVTSHPSAPPGLTLQTNEPAISGAPHDHPELFYQQPPGKLYLHSSTSAPESTIPPVPDAPLPSQDLRSNPSFESGTTEGTEYEIDEHGQVRRDAQGRPMVFRQPSRNRARGESHESDEYDVEADVAREHELAARYGVQHPNAPATSADAMANFVASAADTPGGYSAVEPADYEGAGYGTWEALQSRHHHPTRLSDVLEEDERSRTTGE